VLDGVKADVVVDPAARGVALSGRAPPRTPIVIHEANARQVGQPDRRPVPQFVATSAPARDCPWRFVGVPRAPILELDRAAMRGPARADFGLDAAAPALLVSAARRGRAPAQTATAAAPVSAAGIRCCMCTARQHGDRAGPAGGVPPYRTVPFVDRMELAYAAADFMLCRAEAMTCAELAAIRLPAARPFRSATASSGYAGRSSGRWRPAGADTKTGRSMDRASWSRCSDQVAAAMGAAAAGCGHQTPTRC
jgi:UDP-N-acetylglucosamine--N-acetylmuramyl-(pentapeptide) pyrophosphoryl-undecaprenol N-acetylglucosamine transferase